MIPTIEVFSKPNPPRYRTGEILIISVLVGFIAAAFVAALTS